MKKAGVFFISIFLFTVFVNAQENNTKNPCFRVSSFSSSIGFGAAMTSNTDADYYLLKNAVEDQGQFIDITNMSKDSPGWGYMMGKFGGMSYTSGGSGNGNLIFNLGLNPYSKKMGKYREDRELRFSIGGSLGSRNSFHYYDNYSFVIDTFQSLNGGALVYEDSLINKHYNYDLNFSEVNFGVSYLFKTNVERRVSFYAGIGINYGITLRSYVTYNEEIYRTVRFYNEYDKPSDKEMYFSNYEYNSSYSSSTNNLKNPMQFIRVFIPVGLNWNLSKKPASFWSHVDLYTEMSPGVEFQILSSEKTYTNPYFGVGVIGFRYHW